jgi:hypothetical protein
VVSAEKSGAGSLMRGIPGVGVSVMSISFCGSDEVNPNGRGVQLVYSITVIDEMCGQATG